MPASQFLSVAGQPSISLAIPHDSTKRSSILCLPLSPFPSYSWDVQEDPEDARQSDESAISSPPSTPDLSWDSPRRSSVFDTLPNSVFEDWDDPPVLNVVIEDDGVQTLLITPESSFYYPPPTPPSFEFAPFSTGIFLEVDSQLARPDSVDESNSNFDLPLTPVALKDLEGARPMKGEMLFVDTTMFSSFENEIGDNFALSASVFDSLVDEDPLWAPKAFIYGPDVPLDPLDCIYSAGDISPVERWDEKLWSPTFLRPIRTAPCN